MQESYDCITIKRENLRTQIRKERNESIFKKNRSMCLYDLQEVMKYLETRNEENMIFNLSEFINSREQQFYECSYITKWLLEFEKLSSSMAGLQIYFHCQNEILLNMESSYIKLSATILKPLSLRNEEALMLCIRLSHESTLRSQIFIQELQTVDYIIELMNSELQTVELLCNIMNGEKFINHLFSTEKQCLTYFRAKLFDQRCSNKVLKMYYRINDSELICSITTTADLIKDLTELIPSNLILQLLLSMSENSQQFYQLIAQEFFDYLIELIDCQEFQDDLFVLIHSILAQQRHIYLVDKLNEKISLIQNLAIGGNTKTRIIATAILDKYL